MGQKKFTDTLDIMKFVCKDVWTAVFNKQIDNLRTNHRGVYVLQDSQFGWLMYASDDQQSLQDTTKLMAPVLHV